MVDFMYVFACVFILPFHKFRIEAQPQSAPFIILSLLYIGWKIMAGEPVQMDGVMVATMAFGLWIVGSLAWTDTHQSRYEVFIWLSCLSLFTAARTLPLEVVAWCVFAPGVALAALQLNRRRQFGTLPEDMQYLGTFDMVVFGNTNHNGAFLIICMFAGLMLDDLVLLPFIMLIGAAIACGRCRGAVLAALVGLFALAVLKGSYIVFIALIPFPLYFIYKKIKTGQYFTKTIIPISGKIDRFDLGDRPLIFAAALKIIKAKPIFGWGLNMFRKMMPEMVPTLLHRKFARVIADRNGLSQCRADRVHNDHLEILCELGIVGYLLILFLIGQVVMTPVVICFLIAFALDACFFFPLREPHTAMPFWALAGAATIATPLHWGILQVAALLLLAAVMVQMLLKVCAYVYFAQMEASKEEKDKQKALKSALRRDPLNGHFLSDAAYYFRDSVEGLEYALKGIMNYDGNRVLWGSWDQLSRLLLCSDIPKIAEWATDKSLQYNPEFAPAHEIKKLIGDIRIMGSPDYKPDGQA